MKITVSKIIAKVKALSLYRFTFKKYGRHSLVLSPIAVDGKNNISIGSHVYIQEYSWLGALPISGQAQAELVIADGCTIGHSNHIYSTGSIIIEKDVLTADRVYISDNLHSYDNPSVPVQYQPVRHIGNVRIGEGSWIGENVCIIGASVGKHCVIGANAVVTKDIPDYSVAAGIPAKVIKRYNFSSRQWEIID